MFTSISVVDTAYGASYNITQSRKVADISEFPQSYQAGLKNIKSIYPNATFIYYNTGLDWYNDVLTSDNELRFGRNLINSSCPSSWKSTSSQAYNAATSKFKEVEPGWNQASQEAIEYYMDPRNFLTENEVFQFLQLTWDDSQTVDGVQAILSGTYLGTESITDTEGNTLTYAEALVKVGNIAGVSPYLLAARVRQENGGGKSALVSGSSGYYNFFNIGAYGSTTSAIVSRGLSTARKNGWNTKYKSLLGGAKVLAEDYVGAGKDCLYLQHWNVVATNGVVTYTPYMTNMLAPVDETKTLSKSITDKNANYTFVIPVYENMPSVTTLSNTTGNSNFLLKELVLDNGETNIGDFSSYTYTYQTSSTKDYVVLRATMYEQTSTMKINGVNVEANNMTVEKVVMLNPGINEITIMITAENELSREYVINVVKDDGSPYYNSLSVKTDRKGTVIEQGTNVETLRSKFQLLNCSLMVVDTDGNEKTNDSFCVTNDYLMIKNNEGKELYRSPLLVEGDINRDGQIDSQDMDIAITQVLGTYTMSVIETRSADMNKDGNIDGIDLGMIKEKIGQMDDYNNNIVLSVASNDLYVGKETPVTIHADAGSYIVEGYLKYNEGTVETTEVNNSGQVRFVANGSTVVFENGKNELLFTPVSSGGSVMFEIEVLKAYDTLAKSEIEVVTESKTAAVKITDIELSIQPNEKAKEGEKVSVLSYTMTNKSDMAMTDIHIQLGDRIEFENADNNILIEALEPGETKMLEIYANSDLIYGRYNSTIGISYTDESGKKIEDTSPVSFQLLKHMHENWEITDEYHDSHCSVCEEESKQAHDFYKTDENTYKCVECGYEKTYTLTLNQVGSKVGSAISITPTLIANDTEIDMNTVSVEWYLEGKKIEGKTNLVLTFSSIGDREIDCVIKANEGIIITKTSTIKVNQKESENPFIVAATCNSIVVPDSDQYEYKLNDGKWQKETVFSGLKAGKTYRLYRREKGTSGKGKCLSIYLKHHINSYITAEDMCEEDISMTGTCLFCGKKNIKTYKETAHSHVYGAYEVASEGTCTKAAKEVATCVYCGVKDIKEETTCRDHLFIKYQSDNNATCLQGGTATAYCEYGCGATDVITTSNETAGHIYHYVSKDEATVDSCATEIGTCECCGATNIRNIDGTRLKVLDNIQIELSSATTNQNGLPEIVMLNNALTVKHFMWKNSSGLELNDYMDLLVLRSGETYTLSSLVLKVKKGYVVNKDTKVYINNYEYTGESEIDCDLIMFQNVGQFTFEKEID